MRCDFFKIKTVSFGNMHGCINITTSTQKPSSPGESYPAPSAISLPTLLPFVWSPQVCLPEMAQPWNRPFVPFCLASCTKHAVPDSPRFFGMSATCPLLWLSGVWFYVITTARVPLALFLLGRWGHSCTNCAHTRSVFASARCCRVKPGAWEFSVLWEATHQSHSVKTQPN